jgi:hypothetical protein
VPALLAAPLLHNGRSQHCGGKSQTLFWMLPRSLCLKWPLHAQIATVSAASRVTMMLHPIWQLPVLIADAAASPIASSLGPLSLSTRSLTGACTTGMMCRHRHALLRYRPKLHTGLPVVYVGDPQHNSTTQEQSAATSESPPQQCRLPGLPGGPLSCVLNPLICLC